MKLSATGKTQYEQCQRAFYYERVIKATKDADYKEPLYFFFGRAAHACLEAFHYDAMQMNTDKIFEICKSHGITDEYDCARVGIAVRTYFACWPKTEARSVEGWLETEFFRGRYDAITKDEEGYWILENKFHSQISRELGAELTGDVQVCSYAAQAKAIEETLKLDAPLVGIKYRDTTKNSQTVNGPRSKYDGPLDFLAKGKNGHTLELSMKFDEMAIGIVETEMCMLCCEIELKGENVELFEQDLERCVTSAKRGEACPYFSKCHEGKLFSQIRAGNERQTAEKSDI